MTRTHKLFVAVACLCLAPAVEGAIEFAFEGEQCFHYDTPVAAKATLEICGTLPEGRIVLWKFNAGADLPVTLGREGDPAPRVSQAPSRGSGGQFVAPRAGRYCFTWKNAREGPVPFAMEMEHP